MEKSKENKPIIEINCEHCNGIISEIEGRLECYLCGSVNNEYNEE